ncbi:DUF4397 domain-containing protein [Solwaraspora sp. WMMD1047]|uniref:DUF4397 domain-containing protein n=1 Tax=Solwaraspora sp. WMMD1047 TaxID=3016102 RepID=UPI0024179A5A|nr:DUF4397 domain-containing protein [Solwaraspora sp. WMMD1047]MDG4832210.1 DUF4397 domain-containing protein [Solwaraspora sp. WMMD1047]
MTPPAPLIRALRRVAALAGAALLGVGLTATTATPAAGAAVGYVRLAHLSPDTPAVDVYLAGTTNPNKPQVFPAVGYGALSDYLPLPAGRYAVSMRTAGAPASEPPVLTTEVTVSAGAAYTVAGVGRYADLGLRVLEDDLRAPAGGRAKVRVVQASVRAPVIDVAAAGGPEIASGVEFATTTRYEQVVPGTWTLRLAPPGATPTTTEVTLAGGNVYSLLVLDDERGGLTTQLRVDARGGAVVPAGGVDTGGGGLSAAASGPTGADAPADGLPATGALPTGAVAAILVAGAAAAALVGPVRRRARRSP